MFLVTVDTIPRKNLLLLGLVKGSVVKTKHIGNDLLAGVRSIVGGEVKVYTKLLDEARNLATERMIREAKKLQADGIVCVRYETSTVMDGACEVIAYGTAVRIRQ